MTGSLGELILILLVAFVLFGAGQLPKAMNELSKNLKFFIREVDKKKENDDDNRL